MLDITKIPLDDQNVWDMICEGRVKGCFQIESPLCKSLCKKIKPRNIVELSHLESLARPGCLRYIYDNKSMTQHYSDRKNGLEEATPIHESIAGILKHTHQVICFQEDVIKIARKVAGFDDGKCRKLIKGIGKKNAELLFSLEKEFVEGCEETKIVGGDVAKNIFGNIKKAARYLFCQIHAVEYSHITYATAYLKYYRPHKFYLNKLQLAKEKIDPDKEKRELIMSAKSDGIVVKGPSIHLMNDNFALKDEVIYFGFCNVKNVGVNEFAKIKEELSQIRDDWDYLAVNHLLNLNKRAIDNLIYVGTFDHLKKSRLEMAHELSCLRELTEKELEWLRKNWTDENLKAQLRKLSFPKKEGGGAANKNRTALILGIIDRMENPGRDLWNDPAILCKMERELLGCEISYSELDGCKDASFANCTCEQFYNKQEPKPTIIAGKIKAYREYETKNGEIMCFLTLEDKTGELENILVFPNVYEEYSDIIYDEATVLITGSRSQRGDDSFIVEGIELI